MPQNIRKTPQQSLYKLQTILVAAGLALIALAVVATVFSLLTNLRFVRDVMDVSYYARYAVTILGGFGIGSCFAYLSLGKKRDRQSLAKAAPIYTGVCFGLLTYVLYLLMDVARLPIRSMFGDLAYPWGRLLFLGLPLSALVVIAVLTLVVYLKKTSVVVYSRWFRRLFIGFFGVQQAAAIVFSGYMWIAADLSATSLLILVLQIVLAPFFVAAVAYIVLSSVKEKTHRLFAATVIGALYQAASPMLWEFRTDPSHQATLVFSIATLVAVYLGTVALILVARHAIRQKGNIDAA